MKTASVKENGQYVVWLRRSVYNAGASVTAGGRYRRVGYEAGSLDYFFVITQVGDMYVIPYEVIGTTTCIVLSGKYAAFKVA